MKKFIFKITQRNRNGETFSQKVWVKASSLSRAKDEVRDEYWGVIDMTLIRTEPC